MSFCELLSLDQNLYQNFSTPHIEASIFSDNVMSTSQQWMLLVAIEVGKDHYKSITHTGLKLDLSNCSIIITIFYVYLVRSIIFYSFSYKLHVIFHICVFIEFLWVLIFFCESYDICSWYFLCSIVLVLVSASRIFKSVN